MSTEYLQRKLLANRYQKAPLFITHVLQMIIMDF